MRSQGQLLETQMIRALEQAYDHFNRRLFTGELPPVLLKLSRSGGKEVMGSLYRELGAAPSRYICELSLTPVGSSRSPEEVFATVVHEMAHYLDYVRDVTPKSPGYHGKRWFATMQRMAFRRSPRARGA